MSKIVSYTSCCFSWTGSGSSQLDNCPSKYLLMNSAKWKVVSSMEKARSCGDANHAMAELEEDVDEINYDELNLKRLGVKFTRRSAICSTLLCLASSTSAFGYPGGEAMAVVKQGLLAGRVPGLSEPDEEGWRTYQRPEDKSGGHGVGWSPIIPYKFSVPQDWDEVPVSIADLGGTEIDLRFGSAKEGRLFVIVAPVKRFSDSLGDDTNIEEIGAPEKVINAFGPEVIGDNVEGKVLSAEVAEHSGRKYYQFELEPPHVLITATAAGNRLYLFNVTGNGLQWKRHYNDLKRIADSFRVI